MPESWPRSGPILPVVYAGNAEKANEVCAACEALGVRARAYQCNVADFDAVKQTVAAVKAELGSVDLLVNSAGITRDGLVAAMCEADFDAVIGTNLKGTFNMIRHCARLFLRTGRGRIVNISSVAGVAGNAGSGQLFRLQGGRHRPDEVRRTGAGPQGHHLQRRRARIRRDGYDRCPPPHR